MVKEMALENKYGKMALFMKVNGNRIKLVVKVF